MKTDLNSLISCNCGVVLDLNTLPVQLKNKEENTPDEFYYICPLCKHKLEVEE